MFNRKVKLRETTPICFPPMDRGEVRRAFESLKRGEIALAEGPYRDKDNRVEEILALLCSSLGASLSASMLGLMYFLTPKNVTQTFERGATDAGGVPETIYDLEHIHTTDRLLTAGELVAHSIAENPAPKQNRELTIALTEELYLLIAALLRRMGVSAHLSVLMERSCTRTHSSLCMMDPSDGRMLSFALPSHPSFDRIIIYTDEETKGLLLLFRALNHTKKIKEMGRVGAHMVIRDGILDEFDEADAALSAGKAMIDHPLATAIEDIRRELDILRVESIAGTGRPVLVS